MTDIVERLRVMSRYEHDDLTIGDEAADEIERLRAAAALCDKHQPNGGAIDMILMTYAERISNRLATLRSDNSARQACADIAAEADAEIERLRAALTEVVRVYDRMGSVYVPANEIDAAFDKASTALKEPT